MIKMLIVPNGSDVAPLRYAARRHEYLTAITYGQVIKARGSQARYHNLNNNIKKTLLLTID